MSASRTVNVWLRVSVPVQVDSITSEPTVVAPSTTQLIPVVNSAVSVEPGTPVALDDQLAGLLQLLLPPSRTSSTSPGRFALPALRESHWRSATASSPPACCCAMPRTVLSKPFVPCSCASTKRPRAAPASPPSPGWCGCFGSCPATIPSSRVRCAWAESFTSASFTCAPPAVTNRTCLRSPLPDAESTCRFAPAPENHHRAHVAVTGERSASTRVVRRRAARCGRLPSAVQMRDAGRG